MRGGSDRPKNEVAIEFLSRAISSSSESRCWITRDSPEIEKVLVSGANTWRRPAISQEFC